MTDRSRPGAQFVGTLTGKGKVRLLADQATGCVYVFQTDAPPMVIREGKLERPDGQK